MKQQGTGKPGGGNGKGGNAKPANSPHHPTGEDAADPPLLTIMSALFILSVFAMFGKVRDAFFSLMHLFSRRKGKQGYAPFRSPQQDFYMRRMYGRIVDCWNRPISSAPDAWVDVMERKRVRDTTGEAVAELEHTGKSVSCLNLASYNYLGFAASDPYCTPRVVDTIHQLGVSSCSPRVQGGTTSAHVELEELVARFLGVDSALTYGMGFATNSSTIPALVGPGCLVLSDALNHSSIVAGVRQSGAKSKVFRHNDARHLDALLRQSIAEGQPRINRTWKKVLVIVEGVYSMEGETCNLKEIVEVCKRHKAYIYLDEAHSIGAMGPTGRGVCEHWGVDPRDIDIMMGTFTKSFGSCGGYIAGRKSIVDFLRRHSPAHLYACSMASGCVKQATSALEVMMGLDGSGRGAEKVQQLHDNANYVRSRLLEMGLDTRGTWDSPVVPIMTYNVAKMVALSRACLERRIAMVVVGFPATPLLLTRARICVSAAHSREHLDWALGQLEEVADACLLKYNNRALYAQIEAELQEHVLRQAGPAAAAKATIAAVAAGALSLSSSASTSAAASAASSMTAGSSSSSRPSSASSGPSAPVSPVSPSSPLRKAAGSKAGPAEGGELPVVAVALSGLAAAANGKQRQNKRGGQQALPQQGSKKVSAVAMVGSIRAVSAH